MVLDGQVELFDVDVQQVVVPGEVACGDFCGACGVVDPFEVAGFYDELCFISGYVLDVEVLYGECVVYVEVVIFQLALDL